MQFEGTHDETHRRKATQMQPVPLQKHNSWCVETAHDEAHQRKALLVQHLQVFLFWCWQLEETSAFAQKQNLRPVAVPIDIWQSIWSVVPLNKGSKEYESKHLKGQLGPLSVTKNDQFLKKVSWGPPVSDEK